ncbi:MAG TPA: hypothetical protein VFK94_01875 [Patescibacteria group bacterium]|nr:hypothetical protein [Patescibacteria group bacterium]
MSQVSRDVDVGFLHSSFLDLLDKSVPEDRAEIRRDEVHFLDVAELGDGNISIQKRTVYALWEENRFRAEGVVISELFPNDQVCLAVSVEIKDDFLVRQLIEMNDELLTPDAVCQEMRVTVMYILTENEAVRVAISYAGEYDWRSRAVRQDFTRKDIHFLNWVLKSKRGRIVFSHLESSPKTNT